jgi:hypothetical protein
MDLHHCHHCRLVGAQVLSHFSMVLEIFSLITQGLHYQRTFRVLPLQSLLEVRFAFFISHSQQFIISSCLLF